VPEPVAGGVVPGVAGGVVAGGVVLVPPPGVVPDPAGVDGAGVVVEGVVGVVVVGGAGVAVEGFVVVSAVEVPDAVDTPSPPPPHAATSVDAAISASNLFFWTISVILRMSGGEMRREHEFRAARNSTMIVPSPPPSRFVYSQSHTLDRRF
jgi:hypothetical protein